MNKTMLGSVCFYILVVIMWLCLIGFIGTICLLVAVTLSICGLGFTDEAEIPDIPGAQLIEAPKAELTRWNCSEFAVERLQAAGSKIGREAASEKFLELFPGVKSATELDEAQAVQLAEAYEAMAKEVQ